MLCKNENRDPGHCLKEGRRVTRCAQDLYVLFQASLNTLDSLTYISSYSLRRITKMRENCMAEWDKHWNCLELNNHVRFVYSYVHLRPLY